MKFVFALSDSIAQSINRSISQCLSKRLHINKFNKLTTPRNKLHFHASIRMHVCVANICVRVRARVCVYVACTSSCSVRWQYTEDTEYMPRINSGNCLICGCLFETLAPQLAKLSSYVT